MDKKFEFLTSVRFWQLFLVGVSAGLYVAYPDQPITKFLSTMVGVWFGGSTLVRTVDRATEVKPVITTTSTDQGEETKVVTTAASVTTP